MKTALAIVLLGVGAPFSHADAPPELKSLEARDAASLATGDEQARARYIMDLARLRFRLIADGSDGWQEVDREIIRHPMPGTTDPIALLKSRVGPWHSSRHDYLFNADGTWRMTDNADATTHGTWAIKGAEYSETFASSDGASATTFKLILADAENFIFTDGTHLFFETRSLKKGLPIRSTEN